MTAATPASTATKSNVRADTSNDIQNGGPPGTFCSRSAATTSATRNPNTATPPAAAVSTSASMNSCQTIRARLPPRA